MGKAFGGKVVLITGAGAGIGEAAAQKMAAAGAKVVVNSISGSGLLVVQQLLREQCEAAFFQADISKEKEVEKLVAFTLARYGALHVVVNNAGVVLNGNVEETSLEQWNHTMAVNVTGAYLVSKHCLPFLRQTAGTIVNVSSVAAIKGTPNRAAYSASKGALLSLSKAMAADYFKENVRVNCVCPGTVESPSLQGRIENSPNPQKAKEAFVARQPIGRLGTPAEIAEAILFAASEETGYFTGGCLVVDGGVTT